MSTLPRAIVEAMSNERYPSVYPRDGTRLSIENYKSYGQLEAPKVGASLHRKGGRYIQGFPSFPTSTASYRINIILNTGRYESFMLSLLPVLKCTDQVTANIVLESIDSDLTSLAVGQSASCSRKLLE